MVRKRAFTALAQIKAANAHAPAGEKWHVAGRMLAGESLKGMRRLMLAVAGEDMREQPKVAPLQFLLSEGASIHHVVQNHREAATRRHERDFCDSALPRGGGRRLFRRRAAIACGGSGPAICGASLPYIETGDGEPPPPRDPEPPVFTANSDALAAALRDTPKRLDCTDLWTGVWCATKPDGGPSRGKRHVIVLSSTQEGRIAGHGLIANLQGGRIPLQVDRFRPQRRSCRSSAGGRTRRSGAARDEDIPAMIEQAYLNLLARYEIAYQPVAPTAPVLKVRVQTPDGWGETLIAAASGPQPEPQP